LGPYEGLAKLAIPVVVRDREVGFIGDTSKAAVFYPNKKKPVFARIPGQASST
jgi:hypothetical protein